MSNRKPLLITEIPPELASRIRLSSQRCVSGGTRVEMQCGRCKRWFLKSVSTIRRKIAKGSKLFICGSCSTCQGRKPRPLSPEELPEPMRRLFMFDRQWQEGENGKLMILRTCESCKSEYAVTASNIRSNLRRGRRLLGWCRHCRDGKPNPLVFKTGKYQDTSGYVRVWVGKLKRYVPEHRLVMQEIVGRELESHEDVHHRNGVRNDNRPENLELWTLRHHPSGVRVSDLIAS